jgi:DNA polymerase III delta prime subunit
MASGDRDWLDTAGTWLWDNREWVTRRLQELWRWLSGGSGEGTAGRLLLIGPGGVGKSTAGLFLSGQYNSLFSIPGEYKESLGMETYPLNDDSRIEVVVPPGQHRHRDATWGELEATIGSGGYRGVILANSYGYHSLGEISYQHHRLYQGGGPARFLPGFLDACRGDELEVLRRLAPHLGANRRPCWLLTLVTKQDLWWPEHARVEEHYRTGAYGALISDLARHLGSGNLRHETVLASLVISNFATGNKEVLATTAAGYDQNLQVASLRRFCETLYALKEWEESL